MVSDKLINDKLLIKNSSRKKWFWFQKDVSWSIALSSRWIERFELLNNKGPLPPLSPWKLGEIKIEYFPKGDMIDSYSKTAQEHGKKTTKTVKNQIRKQNHILDITAVHEVKDVSKWSRLTNGLSNVFL